MGILTLSMGVPRKNSRLVVIGAGLVIHDRAFWGERCSITIGQEDSFCLLSLPFRVSASRVNFTV